MLNQQQQPKGRWVYSFTLSRQIFIDECNRIIDPNVAFLKSNAPPKPVVAVPTPQLDEKAVEPTTANTDVCDKVVQNEVVETQQSEPETIQEVVPPQPVVEKSSNEVPALPNPQPAPSENSTKTVSSNDASLKEKEEVKMTSSVPWQAPWTTPEMIEASKRDAQAPAQKQEVKKVATSSFAAAAQKRGTRKPKTTITVNNQGAFNSTRNQYSRRQLSRRSQREWIDNQRRKKIEGQIRYETQKRDEERRRYEAQRRDERRRRNERRNARTSPPTIMTASATRYHASRNAARQRVAPRATTRHVTARRPATRNPPANAHKLVPPITVDKLQGRWINSRNQNVMVNGLHYRFDGGVGPGYSGNIIETDEEFLVNEWILQKAGNVVLWYKPRSENITWRRPYGYTDAGASGASGAASEARDFAKKEKDFKVIYLNRKTHLHANSNLASRKVKVFEKDEPLVVDFSTLCTLGANDNNARRIQVVFPCKGWITVDKQGGVSTYRSKA